MSHKQEVRASIIARTRDRMDLYRADGYLVFEDSKERAIAGGLDARHFCNLWGRLCSHARGGRLSLKAVCMRCGENVRTPGVVGEKSCHHTQSSGASTWSNVVIARFSPDHAEEIRIGLLSKKDGGETVLSKTFKQFVEVLGLTIAP